MDEPNLLEPVDHKKLLEMILKQTMDDYVKLQHPRMRERKYLEETFLEANDMLFDPEWRFMHLENEDGDKMNLQMMLTGILGKENLDVRLLQNRLISDAETFWMNKNLHTIKIPEVVVIDGHIYSVFHSMDVEGHHIEYDSKEIHLNKDTADSENQEEFCRMLVELVAHHTEVRMPGAQLDKFARGFFRLLRMNDCFVGDKR